MGSIVEIPQVLEWNVLVLIPKGNIDTQEIVLLEMLWKVMEAFIDTGLWASIQFHDVLHGLHVRRGMRTATIEIKLSQELAIVEK